MPRGAPEGNNNAGKNKPWSEAIRMAVAHDRQALIKIAEKMIAMAKEGDIQAVKEIGDRLEGKPSQDHKVSADVNVSISQDDAGL